MSERSETSATTYEDLQNLRRTLDDTQQPATTFTVLHGLRRVQQWQVLDPKIRNLIIKPSDLIEPDYEVAQACYDTFFHLDHATDRCIDLMIPNPRFCFPKGHLASTVGNPSLRLSQPEKPLSTVPCFATEPNPNHSAEIYYESSSLLQKQIRNLEEREEIQRRKDSLEKKSETALPMPTFLLQVQFRPRRQFR